MTRPLMLDLPFADGSAVKQLDLLFLLGTAWNHLTHRLIVRLYICRKINDQHFYTPPLPWKTHYACRQEALCCHPVMAFIQDSVCTPIKKRAQQGAAFIENNIVTPIKKQAQQGVHDAGE